MTKRIKNKIKSIWNRYLKNKTARIQIKELQEKLEINNIKFYFVEIPNAHKIKHLTEFEKERVKDWIFDFNNIDEDASKKLQLLYDNYSREYIQQLYEGVKIVNHGKRKALLDYQNKYVNIIGGMRVTAYSPSNYNNSIHLYGACTVRGTGVEDSQTISSYLQKILNEKNPEEFSVVNHGIGFGSSILDDLAAVKETVLHPGDIVLICNYIDDKFERYAYNNKINFLECSSAFERPHEIGEWFSDEPAHTNYRGNEAIAKRIDEILEKEKIYDWSRNKDAGGKSIRLESEAEDTWLLENEELNTYLQYIQKFKVSSNKGEKIGSIVMNCNPFTLGHQYLIRTASEQADTLYIFVVEEDKSFFPFQERIELVRKGVEEFGNVIVLPSGQFIISAITFPGYFHKDNNPNAVVDTSRDLNVFGKYIAPALDIKIRFAGEEPFDLVTRQYNNAMEVALPKYGIEFREIKRVTNGEEVISATTVRKYLKEKNFTKIKTLVPSTTYEYLRKKFGNLENI